MPRKKREHKTIWDYPLETEEDVERLQELIWEELGSGALRKLAELYGVVDEKNREKALSKHGLLPYAVGNEKRKTVEIHYLTEDEAEVLEKSDVPFASVYEIRSELAKSGKGVVEGKAKTLVFEPSGATKSGIRFMEVSYSASLDDENINPAILELVRSVQGK
jgi:hypothetical protein